MTRDHRITIELGREATEDSTDEVLSYVVRNDMLAIADDFSLELPVSPALWRLVQPDNAVKIWIDDSQVLDGFLDWREKNGEAITCGGRDRGGRLADSAADLIEFSGITIEELFNAAIAEWFPEGVVLVNTDNRQLIGGRGRRRGRARSEPVWTKGARDIRHHVNPGQRIGEVLEEIAEQAELMFWSTADGRTMFVGLPNQKQKPSWYFFSSPANRPRHLESNVIDMRTRDDISEMFSEITVCGTGPGNRSNYGRLVTEARATVFDGDLSNGIGGRFARPKRHLIADPDIKSPFEAARRAIRERAELAASARTVEVDVAGHGQLNSRTQLPGIYHFDTVAVCTDDEIEESGEYFCTAFIFEGARDSQLTTAMMVPVGTDLRAAG